MTKKTIDYNSPEAIQSFALVLSMLGSDARNMSKEPKNWSDETLGDAMLVLATVLYGKLNQKLK